MTSSDSVLSPLTFLFYRIRQSLRSLASECSRRLPRMRTSPLPSFEFLHPIVIFSLVPTHHNTELPFSPVKTKSIIDRGCSTLVHYIQSIECYSTVITQSIMEINSTQINEDTCCLCLMLIQCCEQQIFGKAKLPSMFHFLLY